MNRPDFGPYRIEELLGRGGMGEVYRAFDTEQNRVVALKLLLPSLAGDPQYAARFRQESEAAARLREPHIIPIHRYGEIDGRLFIDMRLVEGVDLGTLLADGPLSPEAAVDVVGQLGSALDAAHADRLVHRDVKPANVLCTGAPDPTDFVYLVDFGIARAIDGPGVTTGGVAMGSIDYMAPERFSTTTPSDHRVDVYGLACLLFECLTARRPFVADERAQLIAAHLHDPPPVPSTVCPGVPTAFDPVVARGLAKSPGDRYRSTSALATAARTALRPTPATPETPWWTRVATPAPHPSPSGWWEH